MLPKWSELCDNIFGHASLRMVVLIQSSSSTLSRFGSESSRRRSKPQFHYELESWLGAMSFRDRVGAVMILERSKMS